MHQVTPRMQLSPQLPASRWFIDQRSKQQFSLLLSTDTGPMTETRKEQPGAAPADGARGIFLSCTRLFFFLRAL